MRIRILRRKPGSFVYPGQPTQRTAILLTGFSNTASARVFAGASPAAVQQYRPGALAGTLPQLRTLASRVSITHAVVVFRFEDDASLTQQQRDELWDAFGVPLYEQILAPDLTLLASECDAHAGLHVFGAGLDEPMDYSPCGCGSSTPRLRATPALSGGFVPASEIVPALLF